MLVRRENKFWLFERGETFMRQPPSLPQQADKCSIHSGLESVRVGRGDLEYLVEYVHGEARMPCKQLFTGDVRPARQKGRKALGLHRPVSISCEPLCAPRYTNNRNC